MTCLWGVLVQVLASMLRCFVFLGRHSRRQHQTQPPHKSATQTPNQNIQTRPKPAERTNDKNSACKRWSAELVNAKRDGPKPVLCAAAQRAHASLPSGARPAERSKPPPI